MEKSDVVAKLSALAQPVRLDIYLAIAAHPNGLSSTRVAEEAGAMPTNTSVHLSVLRNAGLVTATKVGRTVTYRADTGSMSGLVQFLSDTQ
ncbi:ArsR family transcriptional regulator [Porphyrobacter sp. MBR-155]|jgi:DNA-binding transcriptional ArsR family regulator|uniref:ArsR/SmtB family transcription factor n=1 Tax=Porphyrobacter sp. MBR-155 TaxID=3156464 RepID=UPI00339205FD